LALVKVSVPVLSQFEFIFAWGAPGYLTHNGRVMTTV